MKLNKLYTALQDWSSIFGQRTMHDFMAFAHEYGLSMPQITVLMRLYYRGPSSILAVRQDLYGSRAAATQLVDRLVQMGLVERSENAEDRRVKRLRLTEAGRVTVEQGIAARRRWMVDLSQAFDEHEQSTIAAALTRLIDAANAQAGASSPAGENTT